LFVSVATVTGWNCGIPQIMEMAGCRGKYDTRDGKDRIVPGTAIEQVEADKNKQTKVTDFFLLKSQP